MKPERNMFPRWLKAALALTLLAVVAGGASFGQEASDRVQEGQYVPSVRTPMSNVAIQSLTEEEQAWLREHPVIRVVQDPGWPPVEFADARGESIGMAGDYLNLIEQRLGLKFERVRNLSWQEAYARLKRWEIDMTTSVAVTPERTEFWAFTRPYMTIPIVIVTHADVTYIAHMRELTGKKVAVVDGYAVNDWIPRDFPDIQLVRVKTAREGLESLQRGEVFATIDNMLVVGYYLAKLKVTNLKIAGETPYVNAQSMAVRKDWAILAGILQKALDSISETERNEVYRKWLPIRYEHGFNYTLFWQALAICAVILLGLVVWNRRLSREIRYRKNAESALRESKETFRQLFDVAAVPLCFVNKEGVLVDFNARFVKTFGYMHEDVPTLQEWWQLAYPDPDYRRWVVETWEAAVRRSIEEKTDIEPFEHRVTCKNGEVRTVVISGTSLGDDFLATFFDITERKRAEQALADEAVRRRILVEQSRDGIVVLDHNGKVHEANQRYAEMLGYVPEEVRQLHVWDWDTQWTREQLLEMIRSVDATGDHFETRHRRKDGTFLDVEISTNGAICSGQKLVFCVSRDITERKRAEAERERLMAAIEQAGETVVITDPEGTIQYVNPAFETVTGYTREEAIGKSPRILKSGRQDAAVYRKLWETISSGRTWEGRMVNKRKDGTLYTEDASISPVRDASGRIVNYVAVKRDITEQLRLADQFEQAQKMESVGRLAGGVAHDFNNMLGVILGYAEISLYEANPGTPLYDSLTEIRKAARRSADLTRQLLAFARKQTIDPRVLDLNETVEGMLKMLRRLIGEDIDLAWLPGTDLRPLKMDPAQIDQILANLCVNARDAIAGVGRVTIETANVSLDQDYCATHAGFAPGEFVMLTVSDDGCGMDEETRRRLFEPFFTTKETGRGTGLGLSTVYGIVKQNDGFLNVYSEPGQGTTFKIYFPQHAGGIVETRVAGAAELPQGHGETVLLVEDEPAILNMGRGMLEKLGYTVLTACSPSEAMRLAGEHAGEIALLMTDVVMPEMNGRELAERLLANKPGMKCLFMSGYTANAIAHHGVLEEGVHFIQKPFTMKALAVRVREVMNDE